MRFLLNVSIFFTICLSFFGLAQPFTLGIKDAAPFVIKADDGSYSGISIDLWEELAQSLNIDFVYEERDLEGMLEGVKDRSLDAAIAAITITAAREAEFDFSHPYYHTGFSILTRPSQDQGWVSILRQLFSLDTLMVIAALCVLLSFVGFLIWLLERRLNKKHFGGSILEGLASGFWWSAVTMTTVGYGDKAPMTLAGRILALIWMFASLILLSAFLAALTSAITLDGLESNIETVSDLYSVNVATLEGSTSAFFLQKNRIRHQNFASVEEGIQAVIDKKVDAMVYDSPLLEYLAVTLFKNKVRLVEESFEPQDYGIALWQGSDLREGINRELLRILQTEQWTEIKARYLGD